MNLTAECELCRADVGHVLFEDDVLRVIHVTDMPEYPVFLRIIWRAHVAEMTDLMLDEQQHLMRVVFAVERAVREVICPHKINLASLGNVVPHVHWHVIARFIDDAHFPLPIWAEARRPALPRMLPPHWVEAVQSHIYSALKMAS